MTPAGIRLQRTLIRHDELEYLRQRLDEILLEVRRDLQAARSLKAAG